MSRVVEDLGLKVLDGLSHTRADVRVFSELQTRLRRQRGDVGLFRV